MREKFMNNKGTFYYVTSTPGKVPGMLGELSIIDKAGDEFSLYKTSIEGESYLIFPKDSINKNIFEINKINKMYEG